MSELGTVFDEINRALIEAQNAQDDSIPKARATELGLVDV